MINIEVKGYETERDKVKWNTCKNKGIKLLVLKKNEIYQIKIIILYQLKTLT